MARFSDVDWDNSENKFRVSFSGGKDSATMLIMLLEKKYPVHSVDFLDSEYEYPEVYDYIQRVEDYINERWGIKINRLYLPERLKFTSWFYGHWSRGEHTDEIRGYPRITFGCYLQRHKAKVLDNYDKTSYRYVGINYSEKKRYKEDKRLLYPLIEWEITEEKLLEYLKERNLLTTYNRYFNRSGCFWCVYQPKSSLRSLYFLYPEKWEQMKVWEKDSPGGFKPNKTLKDYEEEFEQEVIDGKTDLDFYKK